jgi:hypothetical protein
MGTAQLAANAATQYQFASTSLFNTTTTGNLQPIPGQSVTLTTTGGAVLTMFSATVAPYSFPSLGIGDASAGYFQIVRDNTVVLAVNDTQLANPTGTTITMFGMDTPPAGVPHTYTVYWSAVGGGMAISESGTTANLVAIELKR